MITLYRAGAGSGKTYRITEELVRRLAAGSTRPERVLATTFTRKAAAELKDRIRARLLSPEAADSEVLALGIAQRLELVEALEDALIGTVHSVGHQLLTRYALRLGLSPRLEPIEDKAGERHLRRILEETPPAALARLDRLAARLGVEDPQQLARQMLDEKRTNGVGDEAFRAGLAEGVARQIEVISGGAAADDLPNFQEFYDRCADALGALQINGDETKGSRGSRDTLADIVRSRSGCWADWSKVASLKWTSKSKLDAAELTGLARRANVHPALHADLRDFTTSLGNLVLDLQGRYAAYKAAHGLVDYADQEEQFLRLLEDDGVRADLAASLDLVVVDEFQDTNPIQLAIFQRLAGMADSLWVGDEKQAIYGFRGSAPDLIHGAMATADQVETLGGNWRSAPGLVEWVNRLFTPLFGAESAQVPQRIGRARVERWRLTSARKEDRQTALGTGLRDLVAGGTAPAEVAVLVRTNKEAKAIAAAIQAQGLEVLVATDGLLSTREGAMVLAALRLVADRRDGLAAATLRHIDAGPEWFAEALAEPDVALGGQVVEAVRDVDARTLPPRGVVGAVIHRLGLPDRVPAWGQPTRRLANLDALLDLAGRYEDESDQEGKAATLTGLIYWLEDLRRKGEDDLPIPLGANAIQVMTVHKAKGLEWPVVVLVEDGAPPTTHAFVTRAEGGSPQAPLEGRRLRHWTYPFGVTPFGGLAADGCGVQAATAASPEAEALAAARDEERQRLLYVAFTRARQTLILAEAAKTPSPLAPAMDLLLDPRQEGEAAAPGLPDTVYAVRSPLPDDEAVGDPRRAIWLQPAAGPRGRPPRYQGPSLAPCVASEAAALPLPGNHPFPGLRDVDWQNLGQAVHAYLASLPALADLDDPARTAHAAACLARWGQTGVVEAEHVVAAGRRLLAWAGAAVPGAQWRVEVPLTGPRPGGGQWDGIADLILVGADRTLVVDHKSADWSPSGWGEKAQAHAGQLAVYTQLVAAAGLPGPTAFIHLPLGGGVVALRLGEEASAIQ